MDERSNILFFFGEHHRWDWLGVNPDIPVRTPTLDRIARDGVRFDQCRCGSPLCAPSRACLATGLRYHHAGVPDNRTDLDPGKHTFMKGLRDAGYRVAAVGKTDLHKKSHLHGLTGWSPRLEALGFTDAVDMCGKRDGAMVRGWPDPVEPYMAWLKEEGKAGAVVEDLEIRQERERNGEGVDTRPFPFDRAYQNDDFCGRKALELLDRLPKEAPWFLQINWGSAHPPFDAARELLERYDGVEFPGPVSPGDDPSDHQAVRRQYAAMLEGMDEWTGRILEAVRTRSDGDRTVVVYSADHGEMLGDLGRWNKSVPCEPSVRVPLLVSGPGVASGVRSDALVELGDLAPTFLELAGASAPGDMDGRSILPALRGERAAHRDVAVSALGGWRMICDGRFKYVERNGAPDTLHDLHADPHEETDLRARMPDDAQRLARRLRAEFDDAPAD